MTSYPPVGAVGTDSLRLSANSLKFNPYLQADSLGYNPYLYADSLGYANLNQYNTDSIPYTNPVMGTTSPSFQGLPADSLNTGYGYATEATEKKSNTKAWLLTGGAAILTIGAACYLKGRGINANASFFEKLKAGGEANWKSITNFFKGGEKAAAEAVEGAGKNAASSAPRNVANLVNGAQEYTIMKDGVAYIIKGGKTAKIITQDKKVIDKADDITKWIQKNVKGDDQKGIELVQVLTSGQALPKHTSLSYTKRVTVGQGKGQKTYEVVVENGNITKIFGIQRNGQNAGIKTEIKNIETFLKNNGQVRNDALSLTREFNKAKVRIYNSKGEIITKTGKLEMTVRDGKVVSAKIGDTKLKEAELKLLEESHAQEIAQYGKLSGSSYTGLESCEHVYRTKGGHTLRYDGKKPTPNNPPKNPVSITEITSQEYSTNKAIESYFEKNEAINKELNEIISSGTMAEGYNLRNVIHKTADGHVLNISGNELKSIVLGKDATINGKVIKVGETISGKELKTWRETAENENSISKILEMLK